MMFELLNKYYEMMESKQNECLQQKISDEQVLKTKAMLNNLFYINQLSKLFIIIIQTGLQNRTFRINIKYFISYSIDINIIIQKMGNMREIFVALLCVWLSLGSTMNQATQQLSLIQTTPISVLRQSPSSVVSARTIKQVQTDNKIAGNVVKKVVNVVNKARQGDTLLIRKQKNVQHNLELPSSLGSEDMTSSSVGIDLQRRPTLKIVQRRQTSSAPSVTRTVSKLVTNSENQPIKTVRKVVTKLLPQQNIKVQSENTFARNVKVTKNSQQFTLIEDVSKNRQASLVLNFVTNQINRLKKARLFKASVQVFAGTTYEFIFMVQFQQQFKVQYKVLAFIDGNNQIKILESSYFGLEKPILSSFKQTSQDKLPQFNRISKVLINSLKNRVSQKTQVNKIQVNKPYYIFHYKISEDKFLIITFIFDYVKEDAQIISTSERTLRKEEIITTSTSSSTNVVNKPQIISTKTSVISNKNINSGSNSIQNSSTSSSSSSSGISSGSSSVLIKNFSNQLSKQQSSKPSVVKQDRNLVTNKMTIKTEKVNVPIFIKKQIFEKYGINQKGIFFSNIVQFKQNSNLGFTQIDNGQLEVKELSGAITSSILPQIQKLDSNYRILSIKYKVQGTKLLIFLQTMIKGQRSMQTITVNGFGAKSRNSNLNTNTLKNTQSTTIVRQERKQIRPPRVQQKQTKLLNLPIIPVETVKVNSFKRNQIQNFDSTKIKKFDKTQIIQNQPKMNVVNTIKTQVINVNKPQLISQNTRVINVNKPQAVKTVTQKNRQQIRSQQTVVERGTNNNLKVADSQNIRPIDRNIQTIETATTKVIPITTTRIEQKPIQSVRLIEEKRKIDEPKPTVILHKNEQKKIVPKFIISTNTDKLISSVSGVSDPALVPFLTSSYMDMDSRQVDNIVNFIIQKVKITGDFTIVLINQIRYGVRLIIQMKDDHKIFEAIVSSDNKSPQLILWRRISTISDVDPQAFSQYYKVQADQDLKILLRQVLKSEQTINKLKLVVSSEKKVTFDGIYYRIVVETVSGNLYVLVFYYIPDKNYHEIVQYELLNNGYDSKRQVRLNQIPQKDKSFVKTIQLLNRNYGSVLKDTSITYISSYESTQFRYFRIVFQGRNGRYQTITAVSLKNELVTIVRWQKLQDGYVPISVEKLLNNNQYKSVRDSVRNYIKNKFSIESNPSYLQFKTIPSSNVYYKFLFDKPFPFVLYLEERNSDHSLHVRGLERVQIAPSSEYYNDRYFAGYSLISKTQIQFDDVYASFYAVLTSKTQVRDNNHEVLAAFRMRTPSGLFYRVIYRVSGSLFLASFSYSFTNKQYRLLSFEPFESTVEEGDYRWKCSSVNQKLKVCQKCQNQFILTTGRCYKKFKSCALQFASICYICNPGYIRSGGKCQSSPQKAVSSISANKTTQQTIVTATGCKTIIYDYQNDNCLLMKDSVCVKCSYRYYPKNGICKKVQDQCQVYDNVTGLCLKCYQNYYLSNGVCKMLDPLCQQANSDGYCTACYKNYVNIDGKCYIKSNIETFSSRNVPTDPLCLQWNPTATKCLKCQFGTFLSKRTGKCTIQDPFCQQFDFQIQQCQICQRGFLKKSSRKCQRVF